MTDREAFYEFVKGGALVAAFMGFFFLFVASLNSGNRSNVETFVVVAEYKGCDVVRFAPPNGAEYAYFLHCEQVR